MEPFGTALVTGASRGIGRSVAITLANAGFDVIATMRDPAAGATLPSETTGQITVAHLDVTNPEAFEMPPGLRVLVNNAGTDDARLPVEHTSVAEWRRVFETNFFGPALLAARAIPRLRESGGGVIANVTSAALLPPCPLMGPYRSSKRALSAFTETLQAEVAQFNIRVLEILPGPIETDMFLETKLRPPAAIEHEEYRALASSVWASQQLFDESYPPAVAGERILTAILDDGGPLRYGTDDLSEEMLANWRVLPDETWLATMQPLVLVNPESQIDPGVDLRHVLVSSTDANAESGSE